MARYFPFATHAQVLAAHPALAWEYVVDRSADVRERVQAKWGVRKALADVADLRSEAPVDLVVVATPPTGRLALIESLSGVKAVLLEKPMASDVDEARAIVEYCARQGILLQIALWRRADARLRVLAAGELNDRIGSPVAAFGIYGNGIRNNGIHMIDLVRMLLGEIEAVQVLGGRPAVPAGPLAGDVDLPFALSLRGGTVVVLQPVSFDRYRENALDIWGDRGRLEILQEGLRIIHYPLRENRAVSGQREIASDEPAELGTTTGEALYRLYDNLIAGLTDRAELWSPGGSALRSEIAMDAVLSASTHGQIVRLET